MTLKVYLIELRAVLMKLNFSNRENNHQNRDYPIAKSENELDGTDGTPFSTYLSTSIFN